MGSRGWVEGSGPSAGSSTKVKPVGLRDRTSAPNALEGDTLSFLRDGEREEAVEGRNGRGQRMVRGDRRERER
jgi:hypothetical protein